MSALSLEKNGQISSSKRTKHIKAKYFLIKDYYNAGEIDVKFCPTEEMWADVLTKPLQGQKFREMRAFLQNCATDYDDDAEAKGTMKPRDIASSRECVDGHPKSPRASPPKSAKLGLELARLKRKSRSSSPTCVSQTGKTVSRTVTQNGIDLTSKRTGIDQTSKRVTWIDQTIE